MGVINTGLSVHGLRSTFFERYDAIAKPWADLTTRITSNTAEETYKWLGNLPRMREWGQGRLARGLRTESYSVSNLKYESTLEVSRDEIDDDQTGQIRIRVGELADAAADNPSYLLGQLFENSASANYLAYDGQIFHSASHVSGSSGTQDNTTTTNITTTDNPTVDEFKAAFKAASGRMLTFKDDQGSPKVTSTSGLVAVVPPNMYWVAREALEAANISGTNNVVSGAARVISFPWLTTTTRWFLCKIDGVVRPFFFQDRAPVEFGALEAGSEQGFLKEVFLYGVRARYALTYGRWEYSVMHTFT